METGLQNTFWHGTCWRITTSCIEWHWMNMASSWSRDIVPHGQLKPVIRGRHATVYPAKYIQGWQCIKCRNLTDSFDNSVIYPAQASCRTSLAMLHLFFLIGFSQRQQTQSLTPKQTTVLIDPKQKTGFPVKPSQLGRSRLGAERGKSNAASRRRKVHTVLTCHNISEKLSKLYSSRDNPSDARGAAQRTLNCFSMRNTFAIRSPEFCFPPRNEARGGLRLAPRGGALLFCWCVLTDSFLFRFDSSSALLQINSTCSFFGTLQSKGNFTLSLG